MKRRSNLRKWLEEIGWIDLSHRAFISSLSCVACGRPSPSDYHHITISTFGDLVIPGEHGNNERGGTGFKTHDKWMVPVCRICHTKLHAGGERRFWERHEINPLALAQSLYRNTGNRTAALGIVGRVVLGEAI